MTLADAARALVGAVMARLGADAGLAALLGGGRVFDHVPRNTEPPYVYLGEVTARDWSTDLEEGAEVFLVLGALSGAKGRREALMIADRVAASLDGAALGVAGFRVVALRVTNLESARGRDGDRRAVLRVRAVVEPAG